MWCLPPFPPLQSECCWNTLACNKAALICLIVWARSWTASSEGSFCEDSKKCPWCFSAVEWSLYIFRIPAKGWEFIYEGSIFPLNHLLNVVSSTHLVAPVSGSKWTSITVCKVKLSRKASDISLENYPALLLRCSWCKYQNTNLKKAERNRIRSPPLPMQNECDLVTDFFF